MKELFVTCISDTHASHRKLNINTKGDIIIHAGDIEITNPRVLWDFLDWFSKLNYKHRIFIAGNHDTYMQKCPQQCKEIISEFKSSVIYLEDSECVVEGLKIYGSPWSTEFCNWAFMDTPENLHALNQKIPKDIDILVTHSPPLGVLDKNVKGECCGVAGLPIPKLLTVCGHIHESYGVQQNPLVVNCSIMTYRYRPTNPPISVTLKVP